MSALLWLALLCPAQEQTPYRPPRPVVIDGPEAERDARWWPQWPGRQVPYREGRRELLFPPGAD
jgi:hypothetical protein